MVNVELIDFIAPHHDESSSDHDDNIVHLLNLLKSTLRDNLQFEHVGQLESLGSHNNYDVVISEKYNVLIATQSSYLVIYNRSLFNQSPISDKISLKVDIRVRLNCLKLNTEMSEEYIYVSTSESRVLKINLGKLLITKQSSIIWRSEIFDDLWGIDILDNRIYAVDFSRGITVLDCERGETLSDPKLPSISSAFQLIFISPQEMIISHGQCVELFHLKQDKWESVKKTSCKVEFAYSIFYERESQLIYLSDSSGNEGEKIKVINSKDMSLVKSFGHFKLNFGICIDPLSGLLYVCDVEKHVIEVFK